MPLVHRLTHCLRLFAALAFIGPSAARADTVSGTVVDPAGQPIAGARVTFEPATFSNLFFGEDSGRVNVATGSDGAFHIDTSPGENEPAGYAGLAGTIRVDAPGWGLTDALLYSNGDNRVVLNRPYTARGLVVDESGQPLPGIKLRYFAGAKGLDAFTWGSTDLTSVETTSDANGAWELARMPANSEASVEIEDSRYNGKMLVLLGEASLRLVAKPAVTIRGRVVSPDGQPVAGVWIETLPGRDNSIRHTITNLDGSFELGGMGSPGGDTLILHDPLGRWVAESLPGPVVPEGTTFTAPNWVAQPGVTLTARLIDEVDKSPLAGCQVVVGRTNGGLDISMGTSDAEGRIKIQCLPAQNEINATAERGQSLTASRQFTFPAGASAYDLGDIAIPRGVTLTGTALTKDGQPARGAVLRVTSWPDGAPEAGAVDNAGRFTLGPLPPNASYELALNSEDEWSLATPLRGVTPALGTTAAPLRLILFRPDFMPVTGKVVDATGQPIQGALVRASLERVNGIPLEQDVVTGPDGVFHLHKSGDLRDAHLHSVSFNDEKVMSLGRMVPASGDAPGFRVNGSKFSDTVMVRIDGRITGQVVDAAGRPVAGALLVTAPRIDGEPVAGRSGPFPESGPDGHFELDSLPETSLHVFAAKDRLFGEAIALPGSAVTIRLQAPRDIDERVRATYLASLDLNGYRNLIPYWSFLGPDSMKDLALRVDGAISPDGRHNPARAGQAFGLWLQALATKDPVLAGRTGPGLLALYDPECRLEDARQAVAAACARYGDARGWHFASDWINGQMPRTTVFDPSEDRAALLFRLAGTAMILKRADVDSLFRLAVTTANREDKAEVADFAWNWGASLAVSGEPALLRLNGCVSPQAEFRAWAAAVPILAQTDLPAAGRALDRVNDLRTNPAVAAWIAGRGAGQRGWSDSTVDEAENALLHAQTQAGDPELLSAASLAEYAGFHLDYGALAMSALAHHDDATARAALSEAKDGNLAYFASLAATFDAALSQDLFARAADQQIASETTSHSSEFDPSYTYYHGFVDPAMSRVLLESQWIDLHKPDAGNGNTNEVLFRRGQTAAALYALDESRCLELTREAASESHSENSPVPGLAILMESDRSRWALKPP